MYKIYGKYPGVPQELIDEFDTEEEAKKMLIEYRMAYGHEWYLWIRNNKK